MLSQQTIQITLCTIIHVYILDLSCKWFIGYVMIIARKLSICNEMLPLQSKENKRFVFKSVLIFVCNGIKKIVLHHDIKENPSEDSPI